MARPDKAELALEYPDELYMGAFERSAQLGARHAARFDRWKGKALFMLGGIGLITAAMLVGWLTERLAG